ncbi:reverse transcriptase domain-containing protein, partial [Tanacetum coccineum]
MPSHIKTYDESGDPQRRKDGPCQHGVICLTPHLLGTLGYGLMIFLHESIDSYDDLREAFLKNYLQQKKMHQDPIVLHNIKQRDGESTKDFIQRYTSESGNVKGAPKCMRISGFVHGITNPELIKRFHEKIPK